MRTPQRQHQYSVIQRLLDEPYRFDLVQALRMIELWLRQNGLAHHEDLMRHVRFRNSLSMSFPASQIEALAALAEQRIQTDSALQAAFAAAELKTITFTPAFLGFFGVNGVMPSFYTADIADQIHHSKYEGARAFFDIFYNRIMALHYQAACKHRVQHRLNEDGAAAILPIQLALAGRKASADGDGDGDGEDEDDDFLPETVIAHYAGMLRHRPVSASLVENILAEYFDLPIRAEQFIGCYDHLREYELFKIGVQNNILGRGPILGKRVRERHTRGRLHVGPLAIEDYNRFLPGMPGLKALKRMLALFALPTIRFDLRLILRAADVRPLQLNAPYGNRLGYDTSLVLSTSTADRDFLFDLAR